MIVAIRASDISAFIVVAMAAVGESVPPEEATPANFASLLTMVSKWPTDEKAAWVLMLAAETSDEQWSVCVRVLRAIAVEPRLAILAVATTQADALRRQPEWVASERAKVDRARSMAEQEIRLTNGGRLS